jgi:hypothetical protein
VWGVCSISNGITAFNNGAWGCDVEYDEQTAINNSLTTCEQHNLQCGTWATASYQEGVKEGYPWMAVAEGHGPQFNFGETTGATESQTEASAISACEEGYFFSDGPGNCQVIYIVNLANY